MVSFKKPLWTALTSAKREMEEMPALFVNNPCMKIAPDGLSVQLYPNPTSVSIVVVPCIL